MIGFIGSGNIAKAIISGMRNGKCKDEQINLYNIHKEKCFQFCEFNVNVCDDIETLLSNSSFIFITVKPNIYESVLNEIKQYDIGGKVFIDVAAGITINFVKSILSEQANVIRVMPNTPLLLGYGATSISRDNIVSDEQFEFVKSIFASAGSCIEVSEEKIDAVIAVSGSSPAYIFNMSNIIIKHGVELGLNEQISRELFLQTLLGSAKMLLETNLSPEELTAMVTSPNGTTQAALTSFESDNLDDVIINAMDAAVKRSKELTK